MFQCGRQRFALDRPLVMGIVNVTADSFSDGGVFLDPHHAIDHALALQAAGADILDIGGESTRPGAQPVSAQQELDRILPVLEGLRGVAAALSVDTMKPEVMRQALAGGADMINDVNALRAEGALDAVKNSQCGLCLMHMQGEPRTMQAAPQYEDVVTEVAHFLEERLQAARDTGIDAARLMLDPGFGFGKTLDHNVALFQALPAFTALAPVLVGLSRKSMLGQITGRGVGDRQAASVVSAVLAAQRGAKVLRVHDVAETVDALKIWKMLGEQQ